MMAKVVSDQTLGLITWATETWSPPEQVQASLSFYQMVLQFLGHPSKAILPSCLMTQGSNMSMMSESGHPRVQRPSWKRKDQEANFSRGKQNTECVLERSGRDVIAHGCTAELMKVAWPQGSSVLRRLHAREGGPDRDDPLLGLGPHGRVVDRKVKGMSLTPRPTFPHLEVGFWHLL